MVNEQIVDYHPSLSELTSRIHHLMFLWTPKGFIFSPEYFLNLLSNLYTAVAESFKFIGLRLLENAFVSQKIESFYFYSCLQVKLSPRFLSLPLQAGGNYPFPLNSVLYIFPQQKGWKIMELKKWPKLILQGYRSQVLINSTIFAIFTFLMTVLLYHNLDSSMRKCEGSLT